MTLGLEPQPMVGCTIPTEARIEALLWSLSQCRCRGHAGEVLNSSPIRTLFSRLFANDRQTYETLRRQVDAALHALPVYEIVAPYRDATDARPALPAS